ncbi:hypothetical protein CEXT_84971 [Caerostris extrusa]|uniref:Uncharacterized protein n=1 Tax=Caerostris extrusa TaxID=172846 RepID=A0AAV4XMW1_CAEEX|nr:hypothetical protein CEXT_84971 [Caerostris extrusa]
MANAPDKNPIHSLLTKIWLLSNAVHVSKMSPFFCAEEIRFSKNMKHETLIPPGASNNLKPGALEAKKRRFMEETTRGKKTHGFLPRKLSSEINFAASYSEFFRP